MGKSKEDRPEWFKLWRRNRRQLDIDQLDMQSRGVVFTNIMRYFDGEDSALLDMSPIECMAFNVLKINVDDSFSEYAAKSAQNRENANKRWHREDATACDRMRPCAKHAEDRGQKKEGRSGTGAGKPPRTRFVPPTIEQVRAYCQQRGNVVDAQRFVDYYTANGWKVGKNSMQDWKAAVRTWEAGRQQERQPAQQQADLSWRDSRSPTLDDLVEYPEGSGQYRPRWEVPHD
jgi:hypothetical protein